MATVINNPPSDSNGNNSGNNMGMILGVVVILVIAILFVFYGLPMLRQAASPTQVNVPDKIDVNVKGYK